MFVSAKVSVCNLNPVPVSSNSMIIASRISMYTKLVRSMLYDLWSVSASNIGRSACDVPPGDIKGAPSGCKDDELQIPGTERMTYHERVLW